jgi:hypothetical protein
MRRIDDSLLTLLGQWVGQLGPVTTFLDRLVTGLIPQITAGACGCDIGNACYAYCSPTLCSYPYHRLELFCPADPWCIYAWPCSDGCLECGY